MFLKEVLYQKWFSISLLVAVLEAVNCAIPNPMISNVGI